MNWDKDSIQSCLRDAIESGERHSEHQLIQVVSDQKLFNFVSSDPLLGLFHKHFVIMHVLYTLQAVYAERGWYLDIGPLKIQLHKCPDRLSDEQALALSNPLVKSFYLDWQNYENVDADEVGELMASFWKRFATGGEPVQSALQFLGLGSGASWQEVQSCYRKKAAQLHPDKGGNANSFAELQHAFDTLKLHFGK